VYICGWRSIAALTYGAGTFALPARLVALVTNLIP
jgi:hypothetical protein